MNAMTYAIDTETLDRFVDFIVERYMIYVRRQEGKAKPWTEDEILKRYRFCNVHRENDTVTQWIHENWAKPLEGNKDLWFAMSMARWVNWPDTLRAIGLPVPPSRSKFLGAISKRAAKGEKVWTGAYMIGTQGNAKDKPLFIFEDVLMPLWEQRQHLRPRQGDTLAAFAKRVYSVKNQGTFMVGQMVADAKHFDPHLKEAKDWWTWAVSGPGSRRGLNRLRGATDMKDVDSRWNEKSWSLTLEGLKVMVDSALPPWVPTLDAQNLQNCLCEFDKWERVRLGQGTPRSRYAGHA